MSIVKNIMTGAVITGGVAGWLLLFFISPLLIALGFWLIGIPLDWISWKTYAGLLVVAFVVN